MLQPYFLDMKDTIDQICLLSSQCTFNFGLTLKQVEQPVTEKSRLFPSRSSHLHILSFPTNAVTYNGPVVQLTISEIEHQGSVVRTLRSLFPFFFISLLFCVSILFHLFTIIFFSFSIFMISPLLASGVGLWVSFSAGSSS